MPTHIPEGYCQCGCGQKTTIAPKTCTRDGYIKGEPRAFIKGHSTRLRYAHLLSPNFNPSGLCQCGCGQKTAVPTKTDRQLARYKGEPARYIQGHHSRPKKPQYIVDPETGCWNWNWHKHPSGYAYLKSTGKMRRAHAVFYEQQFGPIPDGYQLHHTCENPPCVNPNHLELITHTDHVRIGPHTKLTVEQVREIRHLYAQGDVFQSTLAKQFGVSAPTISAIITRRNWKDI